MIRQSAIAILFSLLAGSALAESVSPDEIRIIDGDTIKYSEHGRNIRLVGFNAPEVRNAKCRAEKDLGTQATERLTQIVANGDLDLSFVRCACKLGMQGTLYCNRGRSCATLKARGQDVGQILISEGLAVPFYCGQTKCPPTPKPWCR